jgi:hypothetical protein
VKLISTKFVPIGQNVHDNHALSRRFKDDIDFYNMVGGRGADGDKFVKRDGFYIMTAEGDMVLKQRRMGYNKDDLRDWLKEGLQEFERRLRAGYVPKYEPSAGGEKVAMRYRPPEGAVVLMMRNKILAYDNQAISGLYSRPGGSTKLAFAKEYMETPGHMYVLLRKEEVAALAKGSLPATVKLLIASSLVDPIIENRLAIKPVIGLGWEPRDLKELQMRLQEGRLTGSVRLERKITKGEHVGDGSFAGDIVGLVEAKDGKLIRFDVVVKGEAVDNFAPRPPLRVVPTGKFPHAFAFTIVDKDEDLAKIPFDSVHANPKDRDPNVPSPLWWNPKEVPPGAVK